MATAHRCGWVALMGPPNAGKSTLTNALVGQKVAIVTAKPQTTRNRIVGILTQKDAQVIFMDTPGVHALRGQTRGQLGKIMVQSAWQSFAVANCIVLVIDGDLYLRKPDFMERDLAPLIQPLAEEERPVVVVVNKVCSMTSRVCCPCWSPWPRCSPRRKSSRRRPCAATAWSSSLSLSAPTCPKARRSSPKISFPPPP